MQTRWHVLETPDALKSAAVARIRAAAERAIAARGAFHLVLAGGNTPRLVYRALRELPTDWSRWHIWFGDERCLPPADPERNSRMACDAWLDHVPIPATQIHPIVAELGPREAAARYAAALAGLAEFDFVLLGLGEDGHTASLFPGHDPGVGNDAPATLAVFGSPKPPAERVSLSAARLAATRELVFLVGGSGKRDAVAAWRIHGRIPAAAVTPSCGADVLLDFPLPPG